MRIVEFMQEKLRVCIFKHSKQLNGVPQMLDRAQIALVTQNVLCYRSPSHHSQHTPRAYCVPGTVLGAFQ